MYLDGNSLKKFIKEELVPIEYYRKETNRINGGLLKRSAQVPPMESGTNAFCCSIQIENFDKIQELILKSGGQIAFPKFAIPGRCRQGYFVDAGNNTFGIFEVDENAKCEHVRTRMATDLSMSIYSISRFAALRDRLCHPCSTKSSNSRLVVSSNDTPIMLHSDKDVEVSDTTEVQ